MNTRQLRLLAASTLLFFAATTIWCFRKEEDPQGLFRTALDDIREKRFDQLFGRIPSEDVRETGWNKESWKAFCETAFSSVPSQQLNCTFLEVDPGKETAKTKPMWDLNVTKQYSVRFSAESGKWSEPFLLAVRRNQSQKWTVDVVPMVIAALVRTGDKVQRIGAIRQGMSSAKLARIVMYARRRQILASHLDLILAGQEPPSSISSGCSVSLCEVQEVNLRRSAASPTVCSKLASCPNGSWATACGSYPVRLPKKTAKRTATSNT